MPWKIGDVDSFKPGLTDTQKRTWVMVANNLLQKCMDGGKTDAQCAPSAIRQANAVAQRVSKAAESAEMPTPLTDAQVWQAFGEAQAAAQTTLRTLHGLYNGEAIPSAGLREALGTAIDALTWTWGRSPEQRELGTLSVEEAVALAATTLTEAADLLLQDDSQDARRCRVRQAITGYLAAERAKAIAAGEMPEWRVMDSCYPYIRDLYDESVVFEYKDRLFRADYTVATDGTVTLGPIAPVQIAYVRADPPVAPGDTTEPLEAELDDPTPGAESATIALTSEIVPLEEGRVVAADGTVDVRLISPGWGSSGYYSADVLRTCGPKIFQAGTQMFMDHPTAEEAAARPGGSMQRLGGALVTSAEWRDQPEPGLYAKARVFAPYDGLLEQVAPYTGVSIRALGVGKVGYAEGRQGRIVTDMTHGQSVDFVTRPGRGGRVIEMLESARQGTLATLMQEMGAETPAAPIHTKEAQVKPEEMTALIDSMNTKLAAAEERVQASQEQLHRLADRALLAEAQTFVTHALKSMPTLPMVVHARLVDQLTARAPITAAENGDRTLDRVAFTTLVQEAAAGELKYLQEATGYGNGRVLHMNSVDPLTESDDPVKANEAIDASMKEVALAWGMSEGEAAHFARGRG